VNFELLPDFLKNVHMYLDPTLTKDIERLVKRHVIAYDGYLFFFNDSDIVMTLSDATHVCTNQVAFESEYPTILVVPPEWVFECHYLLEKVPLQRIE
jgi:hypothetical protein